MPQPRRRKTQPVKRPRPGKQAKKRPTAEAGKARPAKKRKKAVGEELMGPKPAKKKAGKAGLSLSLGKGKRRRMSEAIRFIQSNDPEAIMTGVSALTFIKGDKAFHKLNSLAKSTNEAKRVAAVWALGARGDARALSTLEKAFKDESPQVRAQALNALGKWFPWTVSLEYIQERVAKGLKDPEPEVRLEACRAAENFMPEIMDVNFKIKVVQVLTALKSKEALELKALMRYRNPVLFLAYEMRYPESKGKP